MVAPIFAQSVPRPPAGERCRSRWHRSSGTSGDARKAFVLQRFLPGGGFEGFNVTLGSVIRLAYGLLASGCRRAEVGRQRPVRHTGVPKGRRGERSSPATPIALAERFAMKAHRRRGTFHYALVLARATIAWAAGAARSSTPRRSKNRTRSCCVSRSRNVYAAAVTNRGSSPREAAAAR